MTFIRMTPEDYLRARAMLAQPSSNTAQIQVAQDTSQSQEQPVLILSQQEDRTLIYLGVIIIGVLAILAITAMMLRRRE